MRVNRTGYYLCIWSCSARGTIAQGSLGGQAAALQGEIAALNAAVIPPIVAAVTVPYVSSWKMELKLGGIAQSVEESNFGFSDVEFSGNATIAAIIGIGGLAGNANLITFNVEATGAGPATFSINDSEFNIMRLDFVPDYVEG